MTRVLAHVSDLHFGRDARTDRAATALAEALVRAKVDDVLVTGDVTHRGRRAELHAFERAFAPMGGSVLVVPGNHDRMGDDAGRFLMRGDRVQVEARPGVVVVRLDSTGSHNRRLVDGHGALTADDVTEADRAVASAPEGALVVVMLHHHLLPLPTDDLADRIATWLGWPTARELARGRELLERLVGRCDLVLHGHRHRPGEVVLGGAARPLRVRNAGCCPDLRRVWLSDVAGGRIVRERWLALDAPHAEAELAASARAPVAT